jgi:hypothetical protein
MYNVEGRYNEEEIASTIFIKKRDPFARSKRLREQQADNEKKETEIEPPIKKPRFHDKKEEERNDNYSHLLECRDSIIVNSSRPIPNLVNIQHFGKNIKATMGLAENLYLYPISVEYYCLYSISQYSNSTIKQRWWFCEMLQGILSNPLRLEIISDLGYPTHLDQLLRYRHLITFVGSDLNRIPTALFEDQLNDAFLYALGHLMLPKNKCFMYANNSGLRGEVEMGMFSYTHILNYFFEPSFIIITLCKLYICALTQTVPHNVLRPKNEKTTLKRGYVQLKNELLQQFIPVIQDVVQCLDFPLSSSTSPPPSKTAATVVGNNGKHPYSITDDDGVFRCLDKNNEFYEENVQRLKHDLIRLKAILENYVHDHQQTKKDILNLWSEKANFCWCELSPKRKEFVYNKYNCH